MPSQAMRDLIDGFGDRQKASTSQAPATLRAAWRWLRTDQDLSARSIAVAGGSAGGGLTVALLVAMRDAGEALPATMDKSGIKVISY